MKEWTPAFFPSGTCIVTNNEGPWLYVYGPANDDECEWMRNRMQMCYQLAAFLNGERRPEWIDDLKRISETRAIDLDGTDIFAVGPMVDRDPPHLDWTQDDSDIAKSERARLMDRLFGIIN